MEMKLHWNLVSNKIVLSAMVKTIWKEIFSGTIECDKVSFFAISLISRQIKHTKSFNTLFSFA